MLTKRRTRSRPAALNKRLAKIAKLRSLRNQTKKKLHRRPKVSKMNPNDFKSSMIKISSPFSADLFPQISRKNHICPGFWGFGVLGFY